MATGVARTPMGDVHVAMDGNTLIATSLPGASAAEFDRRLALAGVARAGNGVATKNPALGKCIQQLEQYFAGKKRTLDVPVAPRVTPFVAKALAEICRIPAGQTLTYGEVARRVGSPRAARAIGLAMSKNPIPIVIPCHRVVAGNGLGGFSGKARAKDIKRALLMLEGVTDYEKSDRQCSRPA